ncbi:MAG: cytochrome c [Acidobacteria bacterium]|nr:cytochrome c [Acidobacteriota bacterium]
MKTGLWTMAGWMLTAAMLGAQAAPRDARPASDPVKGREAFVVYKCAWCHGTEGQGGLATVGPRVALVPRSLDSFIAYVRKPAARMSAYSETSVSDAALEDIYAYLRAQPPAKASKDIPLLEQLRKPKG